MKDLFDEYGSSRGEPPLRHAGIPPHVRRNILRFREKGMNFYLKFYFI